MNQELAIAKGNYADIKQRAAEKAQVAEEFRRLIREATMPTVPLSDIDSSRVLLLAGELHLALNGPEKGREGYLVLLSLMKKIEKEYPGL
jgi:hypothetical protein